MMIYLCLEHYHRIPAKEPREQIQYGEDRQLQRGGLPLRKAVTNHPEHPEAWSFHPAPPGSSLLL